MQKLRYVLILLFLTSFYPCASKEIGLLRVLCEPEFESIHDFFLHLDEQENIFSLIRKSSTSYSLFSNQELQTKDVVIASLHGKNVIMLSCPNFHPSHGGHFIVKYLHNGLTNSYRCFPMLLEKKDGIWELYSMPPRKIKIQAVKVIPRKIAGMCIGVQNIQVVH